jgi:hypothetical protein
VVVVAAIVLLAEFSLCQPLLYNLHEQDRQVFSQGMPAEVLQNLVPIVWKDKWASMAPFLLV